MTVIPTQRDITVTIYAPDGPKTFPHVDVVDYGLWRQNIYFRTTEGREINASGMPWIVETVVRYLEPKP